MRLEPGQKERWRQAAGGTPLTTWLKELAEKEVQRLFPPQAPAPQRKVWKTRECVRWMYHRIGVYCSGCDTVIPG